MSTTQKPTCNGSLNGVPFYSSDPLTDAANEGVGFSYVMSSVSSSTLFGILGGIAYSTRGFDAITIILLVIVVLSFSSILSNYFGVMNKKSPGYTKDCQR